MLKNVISVITGRGNKRLAASLRYGLGVLVLLSHFATAAKLPASVLQQPITLLTGETLTLAQYQGKQPLYLKFWASWCQPCRQQMPHFQEVQQRYGDKIAVLGINLAINDPLNTVQQTLTDYGLTMPTAMDSRGDLARAFRLQGTPYHLLLDRHGQLVHRGHEADQPLDNKLALLAQSETVAQLDASQLIETGPALTLPIDNGKTHALLFTATWCDWYLAETRPQHAQYCAEAQQHINRLAKANPHIRWQGIVSRLWTGEKDLAEYRKKFAVTLPLAIDQRNSWFYRYRVNQFPTLIVIQQGREVYRVSGDLSGVDTLRW
ncbi:hypothetical protein BST96_06455 [Oceanicoccus sagamiensis]|uniref:Thioredoxin domain-containing protein n=2 Tax=Oceanicoccus sagamiensis TaxID=716816 RepID=A0A1X9N9M8_9GAMM|nr:hypothetical protein BST96_06455 [Oceanicoccus sagamiensis]